MRWSLNSASPVAAADLVPHLEAEAAHYEKCLLRKFARNLLDNMEPSSRGPVDDEVARQMKGAIRSASVLAESMGPPGTLFLASLSGHVDPADPQGIQERMLVSVEVAPPKPMGQENLMSFKVEGTPFDPPPPTETVSEPAA